MCGKENFFFLVCTAHLTSVLLLRSFTTVVVKSSHVDFWLSMLYSIFCVCFFFPLVLKYRKSNCEQHTESPQHYHTLDGGHTMSPDAFAQVENRTGWSEIACDCDGKIKFRFAIFYGMCRFPVSTVVQHTFSVCSHFICIPCAVLTQMPIGIRAAARAWDLQRMNIANKAMHAQAYKLHIHFSVDISTLFPIYTD